jgi:membrane-bound lytic murein transglycosylase D
LTKRQVFALTYRVLKNQAFHSAIRLSETRMRPFLVLLVPACLAIAGAGCSSQPRAQLLAPAPLQVRAPEPDSSEAYRIASEHFYRGKAHALSGDAGCARLEFDAALDTVRKNFKSGKAEDLAFAQQLYESVDLYRMILEGRPETEERPPAEDTSDTLIAQAPPAPTAEEVAKAKQELYSAAPAPAYDMPVVVNEAVLRAIAFYQFRTPQHFAAALKRSGRYLPMMRQILKEQGLPKDLVYIAMIESAFKPVAHSRAGAHGFWQFIDGTASRYSLRKTRQFDERSDPVKSTLAAAAYFRDLYELFGDWYLAMAGYNAGEGRVIRSLQRTGARDYWELNSMSALHPETQGYVPFFLATMIIAKDPIRFGFDVVPDPPLEFDMVELNRSMDLAKVASAIGSSVEDLRTLNSELTSRFTPRPESTYPLRVPVGAAQILQTALASLPSAPEYEERRVAVKKGDTPARLAARYGMSVADFSRLNDLPAKIRLRRGSKVTVLVARDLGRAKPSTLTARGGSPARASVAMANAARLATSRQEGEIRALPTPSAAVTKASVLQDSKYQLVSVSAPTPVHPRPLPDTITIPAEGFETETVPAVQRVEAPNQSSATAKPRGTERESRPAARQKIQPVRKPTYTVRRGDTLYRIAEKHGVTVETLARQNRLRPRTPLKVGQRLALPMDSAR